MTSFGVLLTVIFLILALVKVDPIATWEWWQVLMPAFIGLGIDFLFLLVGVLFAALGFRKL